MKQTAVEWLIEQYEKAFTLKVNNVMTSIIEQAKEMEKQQIMNTYIIADSESTQEDSEHNALKFYERTYGSKGSDELHEDKLVEIPTSSQTEISDEEIEKELIDLLYDFEYEEIPHSALYKFDYEGCAKELTKWYREQLKQK